MEKTIIIQRKGAVEYRPLPCQEALSLLARNHDKIYKDFIMITVDGRSAAVNGTGVALPSLEDLDGLIRAVKVLRNIISEKGFKRTSSLTKVLLDFLREVQKDIRKEAAA